MKNIYTMFLCLLFMTYISIGSVNAMCIQSPETKPMCGINGNTYTWLCYAMSDTSSWSIPMLHEWECEDNHYTLSESQKEKIYNVIYKYLNKRDYIGNLYGDNLWYNPYSGETLNPKWQNFVNKALFPAVKNLLQKENKKNKT